MENIIGFFGGDSQVGTTMTAWSFAERLSGNNKKVLFLFGSGENDQAYFSAESGSSMDDLKAQLRSGWVERDDLFSLLAKRKNLWILPGTKDSLGADYFPENTFEVLLSNVLKDFDYVVIDGGHNVRLGVTISALNVCDCRYFLITQQAKTLHRFLQCKKNLLAPLGLNGEIIINKYRRDPSLFLKKDVASMVEEDRLYTLPYVENGWNQEMERRNLLSSIAFTKAIDSLIKSFVVKEKKVKKWKNPFV